MKPTYAFTYMRVLVCMQIRAIMWAIYQRIMITSICNYLSTSLSFLLRKGNERRMIKMVEAEPCLSNSTSSYSFETNWMTVFHSHIQMFPQPRLQSATLVSVINTHTRVLIWEKHWNPGLWENSELNFFKKEAVHIVINRVWQSPGNGVHRCINKEGDWGK